MQFFNIDLHVSVIADIRTILESMGHSVTDWSISAHAWVMGRSIKEIDIVNRNTWKRIDADMCDAFYRRYKEELDHYDAFIVTHTPCFAMLFERWQKPIIIVASTRYEQPFTADRTKWEMFNNFLRKNIDSGLIIPLANNKYDSAYAKYFTQREWKVIPSLCDYTNSTYTGLRNEFLYWSRYKGADIARLARDKDTIFRSTALSRILRRAGFTSCHAGYSWRQLAEYRGVIHIPYNASVMSIFEQYTANIPLIVPSLDFLSLLHKEHYRDGVLSQLSFNQVYGLPSCSVIPSDERDPNNFVDNSVVMSWMKLADYYDETNLPYIVYFESLDHLSSLIRDVDFAAVSTRMRDHNLVRRKQIHEEWAGVLEALV